MDKKLRERDLLWCRALVATLGTDDIAKVTAEFNRIRPDKAVEHRVQADAHPEHDKDCSIHIGYGLCNCGINLRG